MSTQEVEKYLEALTNLEMEERKRRGLPPTHVLNFEDFPFRYAAPAFKDFIQKAIALAPEHKDDAFVQILGVYAAILAGDYQKADAFMEVYSAHKLTQPLRAMRFTRRYESPPIDLPPIRGEWPTGSSLFVSCDPAYLEKYGTPLLRSLAASVPGANVHVHVMGEANIPGIAGIHITHTSEMIPAAFPAREYFGAVRLARFAEALAAAKAPLIMVDADALVTGDYRPLFNGDHAGMRVRPGRVHPWTHFSACCLRGTPSSLSYFEAVADIVLRTMHVPFWGMDQYALFAAYVQERPLIDIFGPDVASVVADTPGIFWFTAGNAKLSLSSDPSPYAQLFRRFSSS